MTDFFDKYVKVIVVIGCLMVAVPLTLVGSVLVRMISQAASGECVEIPMTSDSCNFDRTFWLSIEAPGVVKIFAVQPDGTERLISPALKQGKQKVDWLPMPKPCLSLALVARDPAGHDLARRDRTCWGDVWTIIDASP